MSSHRCAQNWLSKEIAQKPALKILKNPNTILMKTKWPEKVQTLDENICAYMRRLKHSWRFAADTI